MKLFTMKKKRDLTPSEMIQVEQNKVAESFGLFTKLRNDIQGSISNIELAKEEGRKRKMSLEAQLLHEERTLELADAEIQANKGLLGKIEEFIPSKEVL